MTIYLTEEQYKKVLEADDKPLNLEAIKRFKHAINKLNNFKSVEINLEQLK